MAALFAPWLFQFFPRVSTTFKIFFLNLPIIIRPWGWYVQWFTSACVPWPCSARIGLCSVTRKLGHRLVGCCRCWARVHRVIRSQGCGWCRVGGGLRSPRGCCICNERKQKTKTCLRVHFHWFVAIYVDASAKFVTGEDTLFGCTAQRYNVILEKKKKNT